MFIQLIYVFQYLSGKTVVKYSVAEFWIRLSTSREIKSKTILKKLNSSLDNVAMI